MYSYSLIQSIYHTPVPVSLVIFLYRHHFLFIGNTFLYKVYIVYIVFLYIVYRRHFFLFIGNTFLYKVCIVYIVFLYRHHFTLFIGNTFTLYRQHFLTIYATLLIVRCSGYLDKVWIFKYTNVRIFGPIIRIYEYYLFL